MSNLRELGHRVTSEDLVDFCNRYGIKKKDKDLALIQLDLLGAAAKVQVALQSKGCYLADSCIILDPEVDRYPLCEGPLYVVRTSLTSWCPHDFTA